MRRFWALAVALFVLLALGGCGNGTGEDDIQAPPSTAPEDGGRDISGDPAEAPLSPGVIDWEIGELGTIRFTLKNSKFYGSLKEAGVSITSYDSFQRGYYDNYLLVTLTVERLDDWDDPDAEFLCHADSFTMYSPNYDEPNLSLNYDPSWFSLGSDMPPYTQDPFAYYAPEAGQVRELELLYGITNWTMATIRAQGSLWLMESNTGTLLRLSADQSQDPAPPASKPLM